MEEDPKTEYHFGWGPCRSKCLDYVFANKKFFLLIAFFAVMFHGTMISGFFPVIISTLEKRYSFTSSESAALFGIVDAVTSVSIIFITYFGGKAHKPRFIGAFVIIMGIGALLLASPQFIFGSYSSVGSSSSIINSSIRVEKCLDEVDFSSGECLSTNAGAYTFILIGQALIGIGSSPLYTIVLAYLDEIVFPKYISIFFAVYLVSSVIGPAIGFGLGSAFLSVYVDPWIETSLTPEDPAWIGAWWIGYVLIGILLLLLSIPFLMFPRYLPDSYLVRQERAKEMAKIYPSKYANEDTLTITVKMFPIHIKRLLLNPSFLFLSFGLAISFIVKDGMVGFGPKYVETMFSITATESGLLAGGVGIAGASTITGGLIIYCFKLKGRQAGLLLWVVLLLCIPATFLYFLRCPTSHVAGVLVPYPDGAQYGPDSGACARQCNCTSNVYQPVCGADSLTYFSSCYAGCANILGTSGNTTFENCTCVMESLLMMNGTDGVLPTAIDGKCSIDCGGLLWVFVVIVGVLITMLLLLEAPYFYSTLRVVADDQRHLALGIQSFIYKIFGSIPGYFLFGLIFDSSCALWNFECGRRGNCWIYNNNALSINAFAMTLPACSIATLCFFLHWLLYPKRKDEANDETSNNKLNGKETVKETELN